MYALCIHFVVRRFAFFIGELFARDFDARLKANSNGRWCAFVGVGIVMPALR
jgi:hypothetical protein